jgi:hypothetical protein
MARYNTVLTSATTTTTATQTTPAAGLFTKFTGTSYTVTISNPTLFSGSSQTFYNAASGTITLSTPSGTFIGPGSSGTSTQNVSSATTLTIYSDGTNWITSGGGGPLVATTGTFAGAVSGITTLGVSGLVTSTLASGNALSIASTDDSSNATSGSIQTAGGIASNKSLTIGKAGNTGSLRILGSTSGSVTFTAAATAGSASYVLPNALPGSSGLALVSDTSGTLTWAAAGATITDDTSTNATYYPTISTSTSGSLTSIRTSSSKFTFNPSTGLLTVTSLTESSSIALKENINPITNGLNSVLNLQAYTYDRKDGSKKDEAGLIAEEVAEVLPNIVTYDADGKPSGINYTKLSAYLIEAVKSLKQEINDLKGIK